ncbi:MAG: cyclase family protein [Negativicutes bacterium]|nr:cyclase family protein [Negativicutes bacterium]
MLTAELTVYPGTPQPLLRQVNTIEDDYFRQTALTLYSHHGTHMDAPAHIFLNGKTLDQFPPERFLGSAAVVDGSRLPADSILSLSEMLDLQPLAEQAEFVLLHTGWSRYWGSAQYNNHYPSISPEIAQWLVQQGKKGFGVDTTSVDRIDSLVNHRILLEKEILIIENLSDLQRLGRQLLRFYALPLHYLASDGAPVRAIAICGEENSQ